MTADKTPRPRGRGGRDDDEFGTRVRIEWLYLSGNGQHPEYTADRFVCCLADLKVHDNQYGPMSRGQLQTFIEGWIAGVEWKRNGPEIA